MYKINDQVMYNGAKHIVVALNRNNYDLMLIPAVIVNLFPNHIYEMIGVNLNELE